MPEEKKQQKEQPLLNVKVAWSPIIGKETVEEKALAVSSKNMLGDFDVLPNHISFITLITKNLTIHLAGQKKIEYQFDRGVLEVSQNNVSVFLGI